MFLSEKCARALKMLVLMIKIEVSYTILKSVQEKKKGRKEKTRKEFQKSAVILE
jgi:hypothetical protein